jgi:hypothetical protein
MIIGIAVGVGAGLAALAAGVYFVLKARRNKLPLSIMKQQHTTPPPGHVAMVDVEAGVSGIHPKPDPAGVPGRVAVIRAQDHLL